MVTLYAFQLIPMKAFIPRSLLTAAPSSGVLGSTRVAFKLEQVVIALLKPRGPVASMILNGISVYNDTVRCHSHRITQQDNKYWAVQKNLVKGCRQTLDCYCVSCELLSASIADALLFVVILV